MRERAAARIVYFDDRALPEQAILHVLEQSGYRVVAGPAGCHVRDDLTEPDVACLVVAFTDAASDGLELIRALANRAALPPTVMLTVPGCELAAAEMLTLGADEYLIQEEAGAGLELLPTLIERAIAGRRQGPDAPAPASTVESSGVAPEYYQRLVEGAPLGMLSCDRDGNILTANHHMLDMIGSPSADFTKREANLLAHPALVEAGIADIARQCLATGEPSVAELPYTSAFGRALHLRFHLAALRDSDGDIIGAQAIVEDVTDHVAAAQALRQGEYLLEASQALAHLGSYKADMGTGALQCTAEVFRILGTPVETFGGTLQDFFAFLDPADLPALSDAFFAGLTTATPQEVQVRIHRPDGQERIGRIRAEVAAAAEWTPTHIVGTLQDITESVRTEQALRESEERYRALVEDSPLGVLACDRSGRMIAFNARMLNLMGAPSREAAMQVNFLDAAPLVEAGNLNFVRRCLEEGERLDQEVSWVTRWGKRVNARIYYAPLRDDAQHVTGVQMTVEDITARLRAEEELERRREFEGQVAGISARLINADPAEFDSTLTAVLAQVGEFLQVDNAALRVSGEGGAALILSHRWLAAGLQPAFPLGHALRREEMPWLFAQLEANETMQLRFPEDLPPEAERERTLTGLAGDRGAIALPLWRGGALAGMLSVVVRHDERAWSAQDVALVRFVGDTLINALTRQQAETALRKSEASLTQAQAIAHLGNWDWEITENILHWSDEIYRIFGVAPREFAATYEAFLRFVHPEDRATVERHVSAALEGNAPYNIDHRIVRSDGTVRWVHEQAEVQRDSGGVPARMFGTVLDITERKEATLERERLEAQLRQSQKMEAMGTLAGGIAHDFNNLLTAILGFGEMVEANVEADSPPHAYIHEVLIAAQRAQGLVGQILAFSRQTEGERRPMDLEATVREVLGLLRAGLPSNIHIRADLQADGLVVRADPSQLHQILMNLCGNASYAMPDGGMLEVLLTPHYVSETPFQAYDALSPGAYARLVIRDTGMGMTPEVLERIFEPYFTTKEVGKGTGMGLAVVHGIVTSMNGAITVDSVPGRGTEFQILLPTIRRRARPTPFPPTDVPRGTERVLLVEDETPVRQVVAATLSALGYDVTDCADGEEAVERLQAEHDRFDIVVTDKTMPKMTGTLLAWHIRTQWPRLPVILCTGFQDSDTQEAATSAGVARVLDKPVNRTVLAHALREELDRAKRYG